MTRKAEERDPGNEVISYKFLVVATKFIIKVHSIIITINRKYRYMILLLSSCSIMNCQIAGLV